MATNATIAVSTTTTDPLEVSSFFTKLPIELRFAIYRFALDNEIDDITDYRKMTARDSSHGQNASRAVVYTNKSAHPALRPNSRGALALLHTNRGIRAESVLEMPALVKVKCSKI